MFSSALKSFQSNISAKYSIAPQPTSVSGAWKIFDGKNKTSGKSVSIFVFDRKSLDPNSGGLGGVRSGSSQLKKLHDEVIARIKKECSLLARLRHPCILELAEPIEDTRSGGLMFATEPVTASLAGLLQEKDDQERAGGVAGRPSRFVIEEADGQRRRRELEIDELEIQKGLLQVSQGLEFLHESAGLVHGNLTPEAIYVNVKVCSFCTALYVITRLHSHHRGTHALISRTDTDGVPVRLEDCRVGFRRTPRQFQFAKYLESYFTFRSPLPRASITTFSTAQS